MSINVSMEAMVKDQKGENKVDDNICMMIDYDNELGVVFEIVVADKIILVDVSKFEKSVRFLVEDHEANLSSDK